MAERFNDQLLDEFAYSFYGYGNYSGSYWFVGMEEGGGNTFVEINNRLIVWERRGKNELEDLAEYHLEIGILNLFSDNAKLQPTWNKLIRILLSGNFQTPTTEQVRQYQKKFLGRIEGDTCLVELLPLPSPSLSSWLYSRYSQLIYLINREEYKLQLLAPRIAKLKRRIEEYKPKVVIFYGFSYQKYWQEIAETDFVLINDEAHFGYNKSTLFVLIKHPATKGVTNEYFHQIGRAITARL